MSRKHRKKRNSTAWRSFTVPFTDAFKTADIPVVTRFLTLLNERFRELLTDERFIACALDNHDEYRTNFVKAMACDYGKPYLKENDSGGKWAKINNSAKYYRIMMTQIRECVLALVDKQQLARICEKHGWSNDKDDIDTIRHEAFDVIGFYAKSSWIRNINRSKSIPSVPDAIDFELDYTSEDNQISRIVSCDENHVSYEILVFGQWVPLTVRIPHHARMTNGHYAKPKLRFSRDNMTHEIVGYVIDIAYEPVVDKAPDNFNGILGVDRGEVKCFSAAAVYPDGTCSREFLPSRELENINAKLVDLNAQRNRLSTRVHAIEELLSKKNDDALHKVFDNKKLELSRLSSKVSSLKSEKARLQARDLVAVALKAHCSVIRLENLGKLNQSGPQMTGRWSFSIDKRMLENVASLHGIRIELVNPAFTSQTDPFTNAAVTSSSGRGLVLCDGVLDRDYAAALNIARTEPYCSVRRARLISHACFSSVCVSTSERARAPRRNSHSVLRARRQSVVRHHDTSSSCSSCVGSLSRVTVVNGITARSSHHCEPHSGITHESQNAIVLARNKQSNTKVP